MGMVVRTNTMSINAYRQLGMNNSAVSKSLEKLSSGFRINRAGDDASGLAISEKMKAQIAGLEQASANSQDGISLIQTAEGATTEIHNMLNRMVTLATKSANGTIQDDVDRENIQTEVNALKTEITRIAKSTNFNGIDLLNGNLEIKNVAGATVATNIAPTNASPVAGTHTILGAQGVAAKATVFEVDLQGLSAEMDFGAGAVTDNVFTLTVGGVDLETAAAGLANGSYDAEALATALQAENGTVTIGNADYTVTRSGSKLTFTMDLATTGATTSYDGSLGVSFAAGGTDSTTSGTVNVGSQVITQGNAATTATLGNTFFDLTAANITDGATLTIGKTTYTFAVGADSTATGANVVDLKDLTGSESDYLAQVVNRLTVAAGSNADFTVGQNATNGRVTLQQKTGSTLDLSTMDKFQAQVSMAAAGTTTGAGLTLQVGDTNAEFNHVTVSIDDLTAEGLGISTLDVSDQTAAAASIDIIKAAINKVSTNRGNLGALQNRLEYTINNLDTTNENMTAANSRIRDTDMAKEMMNYTKMNILTQAAQAMLAQANQQPQSILQLLQ